jgi:hypothetical protein
MIGTLSLGQPAWAWEWSPNVPNAYKGGQFRGNAPQGCYHQPEVGCTNVGEEFWFPATKGSTANVCNQPTKKAYCRNIAPVFTEYVYVGKAPQQCVQGNWRPSICPNSAGWTLIARDKYGESYSRCQTGHIYLCVKQNF